MNIYIELDYRKRPINEKEIMYIRFFGQIIIKTFYYLIN